MMADLIPRLNRRRQGEPLLSIDPIAPPSRGTPAIAGIVDIVTLLQHERA
jgi:hypothetical protein